MASLSNTAFTFGTTHSSRPIFKGTTSARAFIAEYLQWCNRFKWTGNEKTENLQYCVARQYVNFVKRNAYPDDDGIPVDWKEMRKAFMDRYSIENEDAIALEEKERDLNDLETSRMREDESVGDFSNRFEELCGKINRLRKRLAGEEPPKPEVTLRALQEQFAAGKSGVEDTLRQALFQSPSLSRTGRTGTGSSSSSGSGTSPSSSTSGTGGDEIYMDELMQYKEARATVWSEKYLATVKTHAEWASKWKPPMDDQEMLRLFMARLNELFRDRAHSRFIPLRSHNLRDVIEWMREVERVASRSRPRVHFPSAAQLQATAEALERKREMETLKAQLAALQDETKRLRHGGQGTLCSATGSHGMHPDRRRLQDQDRQDDGRRDAPTRGGRYGGRRCPLCDSSSHTSMWDCPNVCAKCGGAHTSADCDRTDLYCNFCRRSGHSEVVCIKKKSGRSPREKQRGGSPSGKRTHRSPRRGRERTNDSTSRDDTCWNWKEKGSCRFGERCRFNHQGNPAKRPRQEQRQPPAPAPANQATASYPIPPMMGGAAPMPYGTHGFFGMGNPMGLPYPVHQMYGMGQTPQRPVPPPIPDSQPAQRTPPSDNAGVLALMRKLEESQKALCAALGEPSATHPADESKA